MNDFLNFLNTADLKELTRLPGITRQIAGNIIAARPFDAVEDCVKVKGMGKNLLSKAMDSFETGKIASENGSMLAVKDDAAPIGEIQTEEQGPSFLTRLGRAFAAFLKAFLKLVILLLFLTAIGAAVYFGLPFINETVLAPIDRNSADIRELRSQLDNMEVRVTTLEKSIEAHTASLGKLDEIQAALENEIQTSNEATLLELQREVKMTRILDLLGRARLYLAQSNFGLAKDDVQSARNLLAELQAEENSELLGQVITRLDLALGNLPAFPVVASNDLEIAWQLLMSGIPANPIAATPSPFVEPFLTATPTPVIDPSLTATPTPFDIPTIAP